MSILLGRILKPLVYKNLLRHNNMVRWCSSTPYYPFLLIDHLLKAEDTSHGRINWCASEFEKEIEINDEKLSEEVHKAMNVEFIRRRPVIHLLNKSIHNTDKIWFFINSIDENVHNRLTIPSLPNGSQIQNIAMSCLPDLNNKDWVVAVKFSGSQLRFLRHKDREWIDVETTHESVSPYSSLMYSKKDQRFYVPTPGCNYLCSFDLKFMEKDKPEFVEVRKIDFPKYDLFDVEEIDSFTRTDHMVESPSGEQFLISWYYNDENIYNKGSTTSVVHKTRQFKVFREDEQLTDRKRKFMSYTEDIGDLCIFLGRDEAFCVQASSSPGLKPNCIYFVGHNYGVYDITTQFCTIIKGEGLRSTEFPYWPHPLSLNTY